MRILQTTVVIVLLGLTATPGSAAEAIGRLFMTPEQRAALDWPASPALTCRRPPGS